MPFATIIHGDLRMGTDALRSYVDTPALGA